MANNATAVTNNDQPQNDTQPAPADAKAQAEAANKIEEARWQDDYSAEQLEVKYKPDAQEKDDTKDTTPDANEGKPDEPSKADEPSGSGNDDPDEAPAPEEYEEPQSVVTVEDPGEYTAADYSFEVSDKDGKTVKITTPEEADKFAEDDENFKSAKDLKDFLRKAQNMENKLERDQEKWQDQKDKFDEQNELEQQRNQQVETLAKGIEYLVNKGMLPAVDPKYANMDWSDPDVASQPGVKEQIELVNYIAEENKRRDAAGIAPLSSALDAFNSMELERNRTKQEDDRKAAGEARRNAGARVTATSPAGDSDVTYVPKGIAVGNPNVMKRGQANWEN